MVKPAEKIYAGSVVPVIGKAPRPPAAPYRRRSGRMTEAVLEQVLSPGCHVIRPAFTCPEPGRRPGAVLHSMDVTTDVVQRGRDCLLGQLSTSRSSSSRCTLISQMYASSVPVT